MSDTTTLRTSIKDNKAFSFFVSKANKIAAAIYLVTDLFDQKDPLKWSLRENVLEIVSQVSQMFSMNCVSQKTHETFSRTCERLIHSIETGSRARIISDMNKDVVIKEIRSLFEQFEQYLVDDGGLGARIIKDMFDDTDTSLSLMSRTDLLEEGDDNKRQSKGQIKIQKDSRSEINIKNAKQVKQTIQKQNGNKANDRKEKILSIIKDRGEVSVKDIAMVISGCSEKTIQRDLGDLVAAGTINKKGERRWTTYFL